MRDGDAPEMARWLERRHAPADRVGDRSQLADRGQPGRASCSAPTRTSRRFAGSRRRPGSVMTCSSPEDCAEIERRLANGHGLLTGDGASRGNLFSGEADAMILTVSRMSAEKRANPGYRAFLANGFNVTRAAGAVRLGVHRSSGSPRSQQRRREVSAARAPRRRYPLLRAALCVGVRDLIVFGVLTDMMRGRPGRVRDVLELRRGRAPLRPGAAPTRSRRCASSTSSSGGSRAPGGSRRGPTSWSCSPTTARPRARRSSSATATTCTSWSSARVERGHGRPASPGGDENDARSGTP